MISQFHGIPLSDCFPPWNKVLDAFSSRLLQIFFMLRGFLLIFSLLFIRARLCCFIPLPAATLSFQNSFTFQSSGVSEESCIASAFLPNQGEIFQSLQWFLSSLGYPSSQPLHLLPFEQISLECMWSELGAIFWMKPCTVLLVILYCHWKYLIFQILGVHLPFHGHTKLIMPHHPLIDNTHRVFPLFFSN